VKRLCPLVREERLFGVRSDGFFIDIGVPETYEAAQTSVPAWWSAKNRPGA
jgi:NDP-sugar pyrophosphorylase family protein